MLSFISHYFIENMDVKSIIQHSFSLFSNPVSPIQPTKRKKVFLSDEVPKSQSDDLFPLFMDTDSSPIEIYHNRSQSTASIPPPPQIGISTR